MDSQDPLRKKIRVQGIVNILIGSALLVFLISLLITVLIDIIVLCALVSLSIECTISGVFANRASLYPSTFTASRYSRMQFISWIAWVIIGGLTIFLLSFTTYLNIIIIVFAIVGYILIGVLFYFYSKRAKDYLMQCFTQYQNLEPNYVPQSAPFSAQVLYPGQAYPGNMGNPQSYPVGPGQNYYAAQPYYNPQPDGNPQPVNPPVNIPRQDGLRPFAGQAYEIPPNNSK